MAATHADPSASASLFLPETPDELEDDGAHAPRSRRRLALPPMRTSPAPADSGRRLVRDGMDGRRPSVGRNGSGSGSASSSSSTAAAAAAAAAAPVIDLTFEDAGGHEAGPGREAAGPSRPAAARRLPNFGGRNIIDLEDSHDGGERAGESTRAARINPPRPQFSQLRRPAPFRESIPTNQGARRLADAALGMHDPDHDYDHDNDLEIVSERTLSRPQSRRPTPANTGANVLRSITPHPTEPHHHRRHQPIDLTQDDDVVFMREVQREHGAGIDGTRPGTTAGTGTRSAAVAPDPFGLAPFTDLLGGTGRLWNRLREHRLRDAEALNPFHAPPHLRHRRREDIPEVPVLGRIAMGAMPGLMDYGAAAFDMGFAGVNVRREPSPKYEAPPKVPEGFTRSPAEDEEVVCPNCGDELIVSGGQEDEVKQQVWVAKKCGHAYCGSCAVGRNKKAGGTKKGKGKGKEKAVGLGLDINAAWEDLVEPLGRKCVVSGCGEGISSGPTGMIHVFLGG